MQDPNGRQVGGTHYHSPIQHWDFVEANKIPYMEAQIIKYVMRHDKKDGKQDLLKALHFLEKLLSVRYPTPPPDRCLKCGEELQGSNMCMKCSHINL